MKSRNLESLLLSAASFLFGGIGLCSETGILWPEDRALPEFSRPTEELDAVDVRDLSPDEQITFSSLQGQVNKVKPRLLLLDSRTDEGRDTWVKTLGFTKIRHYDRAAKYELFKKYAGEFAGIVLYDPAPNVHFRNLAGSLAPHLHALPMSLEVRDEALRHGLEWKVLQDVSKLRLRGTLEIYRYLLDKVWPSATKRVLLSARPSDQGDLHHTRDMAAATGAAVLWLDPMDEQERKLLQQFLRDMRPGRGILLGWYTSERAGITAASEFGLSTLPADFYLNSTVYSAGGPWPLHIPPVPRMPKIENKLYLCLFASDGDNIQYNQRAMRKFWDSSRAIREELPITWTISPALVDVGPGLLNYYYRTCTPLDSFAAGPSGMGYLMPVNTLAEPGARLGRILSNERAMDAYAAMTGRYLRRAGLRVVTVWDNLAPTQRAAYAREAPDLYGVTVQNFRDDPSVASSVEQGGLPVERLRIPYASGYDHLKRDILRQLETREETGPRFAAYQVDIWSELKPRRLLQLHDELEERFQRKIGWLRADHYFNSLRRAKDLPFNLCLAPETTITASTNVREAERAIDGSPTTSWQADWAVKSPRPWLQLNLGDEFVVESLSLEFAAASPGAPVFWRLLASRDGRSWAVHAKGTGSGNFALQATRARHLRLEFAGKSETGKLELAEWEVRGRTGS